ncbi:MAG: hypothetical protein ACJ8FY_10065 [Gemmataceae bacterium]
MAGPETNSLASAAPYESAESKKRKRSRRRAVIGLLAAFTAMGMAVLAYEKIQETSDRIT